MKRLTVAHAAGELRELLRIEMEWLGEESSNLASATDAKLKVYYVVLKEQIAEVKAQTEHLAFAPEYAVPGRFRHENMLAVLRAGGKPCQKMITGWADEQARHMTAERRIFG